MIRMNQLKLPCGHREGDLEIRILKTLKMKRTAESLTYRIVRHSVDARKKPLLYDVYTVDVSLGGGPAREKSLVSKLKNNNIQYCRPVVYRFPKAGETPITDRPVVIGAGPAGLFCTLLLARHGYRPLLIERGRPVEQRQEDIRRFWESGRLDPSSNVQFGEGGAGTFSDGKLNTLVNDKEGRAAFVLETFVKAGGPPEILYEAKPHVGSDRLLQILPRLRAEILAAGGEIRFETCCLGFRTEQGVLTGVETDKGLIETHTAVLAPGHSARDTFERLYAQGVPMIQKNFAVGMRVSHPQSMIDRSQYGIDDPAQMRAMGLTAAPYKLTGKGRSGRGVYSFCMCPGGQVVNASSEPGKLAVNGMSLYARDSGRANSAIVMTVGAEEFGSDHPLAGMEFQRRLETRAWQLGQGKIPVEAYTELKEKFEQAEGQDLPAWSADAQAAPSRNDAQLTVRPQNNAEQAAADAAIAERFVPVCIEGGWTSAPLHTLLPADMTRDFIDGMEDFGRRIKGFNGEEALVIGLESRTSSPVRIPRGEDMQSTIRGLYPCGEGAGYAGGIMSAAMDGMKTAEAIRKKYSPMAEQDGTD